LEPLKLGCRDDARKEWVIRDHADYYGMMHEKAGWVPILLVGMMANELETKRFRQNLGENAPMCASPATSFLQEVVTPTT
jgi:hypothetical protein